MNPNGPTDEPLTRMGFHFSTTLAMLAAIGSIMIADVQGAEAKWWRGNLHTHSLWSDGNDYPEMIAQWYKDNGYQFLALSDHNVFQAGPRWSDIQANAGKQPAFDRYLKTFGPDWVETKTKEGKNLVRLKPFSEFRTLVEERDQFLLIPSEEVTGRYLTAPVHMNFSNLARPIQPQGGDSVVEIMQKNVEAVAKQRQETGQPMILHLNHPNFGWGITAEEIMQVAGEKFFEVYNGHPSVNDRGDATHASTERMWDIILTWRLAILETGPIYGLATDDSHEYHSLAPGKSNAGRGWVMVKTPHLSAENIILALDAGDFYSSSGVQLNEIRRQAGVFSVQIVAEPGVTYKTEFIGTRKGFDQSNQPIQTANGEKLRITHRYSDDIGEVLASVEGTEDEYHFKGDEIYVRAKVTSTKPKANGVHKGEVEVAWTQPFF
ncbi:MAG: hypothetical protein HOI66_22925 [Verrucomicrobia bacterium]|nr:hypothetical protein [Verrucomicrobiota bacterium]